MAYSRYCAVGKMDCCSQGRRFEPVPGTLPFVDVKISNQHKDACCSRAFVATLSDFVPVCLAGEKW